MPHVNEKGLELIKHHEGCRRNAYLCPANRLTIGYGHLCLEGDFYLKGMSIEDACKNIDDIKITYLECEEILKKDLEKAEKAVERVINVKLTEDQFSALVSFVFNVGARAFSKSTLRRKLNASDYDGAGREFFRWVYANKKKLKILENRRRDEFELFSW